MTRSAWQRPFLALLGGAAAVLLLAVLSLTFVSRADDVAEVQVLGESTVPASVAPVTTSTTTTTTTSTTTTTTTIPLREATIAFTGDTLAHSGVVDQARTNARRADAPEGSEYDFAPMFRLVEPYLAGADLAICHLETPLSPDNSSLSGFPTFNVPREMANGLVSAGYDGCTFASNHSLDRRPEGVADSLGVLEEAGLQHSGAARDQAEYDEPTLYDANGITVASLSYSYGFNGFTEPTESPWLVNEISIDEIAAEAQAARDAGAEYIVLSVHWGTEYNHDPDQAQLDWAEQFAELDLDLVIGHHAHVVQPVAVVEDLLVVYGLGNFLSNQSASCCVVGAQDGMIMQVELLERSDGGFETSLTYVPTRVDRNDFTIVPVADALIETSVSTIGAVELQASKDRTAEVLGRLGNTNVGEAGR